MQPFSVRNRIAHGTPPSESIDVSDEIHEFLRIRALLVRK